MKARNWTLASMMLIATMALVVPTASAEPEPCAAYETDTDNDGKCDRLDPDDDNDGVCDGRDLHPKGRSPEDVPYYLVGRIVGFQGSC